MKTVAWVYLNVGLGFHVTIQIKCVCLPGSQSLLDFFYIISNCFNIVWDFAGVHFTSVGRDLRLQGLDGADVHQLGPVEGVAAILKSISTKSNLMVTLPSS